MHKAVWSTSPFQKISRHNASFKSVQVPPWDLKTFYTEKFSLLDDSRHRTFDRNLQFRNTYFLKWKWSIFSMTQQIRSYWIDKCMTIKKGKLRSTRHYCKGKIHTSYRGSSTPSFEDADRNLANLLKSLSAIFGRIYSSEDNHNNMSMQIFGM